MTHSEETKLAVMNAYAKAQVAVELIADVELASAKVMVAIALPSQDWICA